MDGVVRNVHRILHAITARMAPSLSRRIESTRKPLSSGGLSRRFLQAFLGGPFHSFESQMHSEWDRNVPVTRNEFQRAHASYNQLRQEHAAAIKTYADEASHSTGKDLSLLKAKVVQLEQSVATAEKNVEEAFNAHEKVVIRAVRPTLANRLQRLRDGAEQTIRSSRTLQPATIAIPKGGVGSDSNIVFRGLAKSIPDRVNPFMAVATVVEKAFDKFGPKLAHHRQDRSDASSWTQRLLLRSRLNKENRPRRGELSALHPYLRGEFERQSSVPDAQTRTNFVGQAIRIVHQHLENWRGAAKTNGSSLQSAGDSTNGENVPASGTVPWEIPIATSTWRDANRSMTVAPNDDSWNDFKSVAAGISEPNETMDRPSEVVTAPTNRTQRALSAATAVAAGKAPAKAVRNNRGLRTATSIGHGTGSAAETNSYPEQPVREPEFGTQHRFWEQRPFSDRLPKSIGDKSAQFLDGHCTVMQTPNAGTGVMKSTAAQNEIHQIQNLPAGFNGDRVIEGVSNLAAILQMILSEIGSVAPIVADAVKLLQSPYSQNCSRQELAIPNPNAGHLITACNGHRGQRYMKRFPSLPPLKRY